ncbi:Transcription factor SPATULA [Vitis vinifera]|uniref:Transcription factor SPATULA n=1 Tax=Vitis vinifera TaxID=29760 RepID=A0A438IU31_VITVI|nr:Transcription factor SPATULA [Vitis vinifera]
MADLYGTNVSSSATALALESEDISAFLHHFLHNQSSSSTTTSTIKAKHAHSFSPALLHPETASAAEVLSPQKDRRRFSRSAILSDSDCRVRSGLSTAGSSAVVESSTGINFSDHGAYCPAGMKESAGNTFSSIAAVDSEAITVSRKRRMFSMENSVDDFGCDSEGPEASDVPSNPAPSRSSSKRSRAAETDKASMLDEAIEYLKQLQLQVQMLTMRNGLSLHPIYLPGALQPTQLPQTGAGFAEGNLLLSNSGTGTLPANQEISMQTTFDLTSQPIAIPTMTNMNNSDTSFGFEHSDQPHYGPFNLTGSSKEICHEEALPEPQGEMNCSRKNSSSGVSS